MSEAVIRSLEIQPVMVTLESVYETRLPELLEEVAYLREMLRLSLQARATAEDAQATKGSVS